MAGFLESLGAGLRYGGGALAGAVSPDVYREQSHERARVKESGRDRQAKAAEIMLRAAHAGQIPEDKLPELQQSLAKMGYELPIEALSPSPDARQKLSEYARKKSDLEQAEAAGTDLANFGQPEGLGLPEQGLRGNAPAPLPQVPMPPRPQGMPTPPDQSANPPGVQTFPLAPPDPQRGTPSPEQPFSQLQQDQISDTEALSDNPDYPPEVIPPGPPVAMRPGEVAQLAPVEVIGRRPQEVSRETIPPIVQNEIAQAIPQGTSKVDLQEWRKRALNAARRGVPGAKEELEHVLKLMNPKEGKTHVIDGSLVDDTGRVIYKGTPEQIKAVQEFNAMLDQAGITDPAARQKMWADYTGRKGSGGNTSITFGGLTAGVDANGNPVFAQSSNKGGAQIVEGFKPPPKDAKALTESQGKFTMFYMRAKEAHDAATEIEKTNEDVGSLTQSIKDQAGAIGNYRTSGEMQKYNTAKKAFINVAVLRADSGANIVQSEYDKYNEIYFPQVGDKPERIAMKQQARQTAVEGLLVGAGEGGQAAAQKAGGTATGKPTAAPETMTVPSGKHKGEYFKKDGEWLKK